MFDFMQSLQGFNPMQSFQDFNPMQNMQQLNPLKGIMGALGNPQGYALDQAMIPGDDEWNKDLQMKTRQGLATAIPKGATFDDAQDAMNLRGGSVAGGTMTRGGQEHQNKMNQGLMSFGQQLRGLGNQSQAPMQMPMPMPQMQMPQMQQRGAIPMPYSPYAKPLVRR